MRIERLAEGFAAVDGLDCSPVAFARAAMAAHPELEAVPAKASVGVYWEGKFDPNALASIVPGSELAVQGRTWRIPVCYEMGPDLAEAARLLNLSEEELIELHTSGPARCFSVGFCPGFGYCDIPHERLGGLGRLASPRPVVEPGMVGLTGKMTAIYPQQRPAGWRLIGRTPLTVTDLSDDFYPLQPGDELVFFRIVAAEYHQYEGRRIEPELINEGTEENKF